MNKQYGVHVYVMCCAEYRTVVSACVESIKNLLQDKVLSINIISNTIINEDGCNLIKDIDLWNVIDPNFEYKSVYNHNWIKQQLFKLYFDKIVDGNIVTFEADKRLIKPVSFFTNNKINFYTGTGDGLNKQIAPNLKYWVDVDIHKVNDTQISFIDAECLPWKSFTIKEMREVIENKFSMSFIDVVKTQLVDKFEQPTMCDYDLYGNYMVKYHSNLINHIYVNEKITVRDLPDNINSNNRTETAFLTFYQQVRGIDWPNCFSEKDFPLLPQSIQDECINIYGYKPKN